MVDHTRGPSPTGSHSRPITRGRRRLFAPAVFSALALAAAGCDRAAPLENLVVIAAASDIDVPLPVSAVTPLAREINPHLFLSLNSARWEEGRISYVADERTISRGWELGPDSTTLTYSIRPGLVWSDGEPIEAHDAAFTYDLMRRPETGSPDRSAAWEELDSVVALDAHRVSFFFARRHPRMLFATGFPIIPEHIFGPHSADSSALTEHPSVVDPAGKLVVSGPFQIAEWRPGERLILEQNPRSAIRAQLDRVVFRVIPDEGTRLIELLNGAVDFVYPVPSERVGELAAQSDLRIVSTGPRYYDFIAWNPARFAPFADPEVRRALSYAIDRDGILAGLQLQGYSATAGPYPPIFSGLVAEVAKADAFLPDSAAAILAAKGWRDGDGDGVIERDGQPFSFTIMTSAERIDRRSAIEIIQQSLGDLGIEIDVELLDNNTLIEKVFLEYDFVAALAGWSVRLDPSVILDQFWPAETQWNITRYASAALDSLVPIALAAATVEEAAPYWSASASTIAQDRPYAFLWFYSDIGAMNERIRGAHIDPLGAYQNLHEWRMEP